ncbi:MAG: dihydroorotase [Gammaproteobacteria bacterium]|nr:dihydroorotase [Gammaproteobacteria bacterium]MDA7961845.1 dihydroorotase [Gammaproteobacteria bacterium]MDA7995503.1 dihydroorotase [Gammaproteobacteria bacterium]
MAKRDSVSITRPDDWHVHLRRGEIMEMAARHTAARFARAMVMPNLSPPVRTVAEARVYRDEIAAAAGKNFQPLLSLYLTGDTGRDEVARAAEDDAIVGFKLYPAGATTNSDAGVRDPLKLMPLMEEIAARKLVLQVHAETTAPEVDVFDREAVFIERVLAPLHREVPELKIVLEHATTIEAVQFVRDSGAGVAATITAHHLLLNRNEMFRGGLRPHAYCLPVLKRERHRRALLEAACGGEPSFFLGSDSAPHPRGAKESACGCAGIYTAHAAMELYAEVFDAMDALDKLEGFASHHGADFYGMPHNAGRLELRRKARTVERVYAAGGCEVVPLRAGQTLAWSLAQE